MGEYCSAAWEAYEFKREKNKELQVKISAQSKEIEELKDLLRLHLPLMSGCAVISDDDRVALRVKTEIATRERVRVS